MAILALSPRDVGSMPKRKKKPTVPQSEFVYSAFGCRAVAMSSNVCEYSAFKLAKALVVYPFPSSMLPALVEKGNCIPCNIPGC